MYVICVEILSFRENVNIHLISRNAIYLFICPKGKAFDLGINILAVKVPQILMGIFVWISETCISLEKMVFSRSLVHVMHHEHTTAMRNCSSSYGEENTL